MTWKKYKRTNEAEMRPYDEGETLDSKVSVSAADKKNGSPKVGDMIARNIEDHDDQWLVAKDYFDENFEEANETLKGGLGDNMTVGDFAKKYKVSSKEVVKELKKGVKVEKEHTDDPKIAREIAVDHLAEDLYYYDKLKQVEAKEQTMSGGSGSFEAPMGASPVKREIHNSETNESDSPPKKGEYKEATTSSVSANGQYDAPFGTGKKDPLELDAVEDIKASKIGKKDSSPFDYSVDVKDKCKTFPYCNQGDINALTIKSINETIKEVSKEYGLPIKEVEKIVLKEFK